MPQVTRGADSNQCATTPDELYLPIRDFWLPGTDLAADECNTKCPRFYTEEDNALTKPWNEVATVDDPAWCNHPYAICKEFTAKAHDEALRNAFVIMLQPAALHRAWYRKYVRRGPCGVVILSRPVKFGGYTTASPTLHALYFWHRNMPGGVIAEWDYLDTAEGNRIFKQIKEWITHQ